MAARKAGVRPVSGQRGGRVAPRRIYDGRGQEARLHHFSPVFFFLKGEKDGGSTRKRISPPLPKILLCADPHWEPALLSRRKKCKLQQPNSRTACVITVATQPGMLRCGWGGGPLGGGGCARVAPKSLRRRDQFFFCFPEVKQNSHG